MKDYSNFHTSYKDNLSHSANTVLNIQLNGAEGYDSIIDGVPYRIIVQDHTNPMNEYREDRKIICDVSVSIHRGSIIEIGAEKYIVITEIDSNNYYKSAKMTRTNNSLKWKNDLGVIVEVPCVLTNRVLYSDGIKSERYGVMQDGKLNVIIGKTQDTDSISEQHRFIFDKSKRKIFKTSLIDDFSMRGIVNITMIQDQYRPDKDDLTNNLADNTNSSININLQVTNKELYTNDTYQLSPIISKDNIPFDTALIYESTNTNVATVSPTGLVTSIGLGNCIVKIKLKDNPTIESSLTINVIASNQDVYSVGIVGSDSIKKLSSNTYDATVYKNGVAITDNVVWNIMGETNKIEIVSENATDITIKALDSVGTIEIYAIRQDHSESAHKTVNLTALW